MIGRKKEISALNELLDSKVSEFAVVYGRRRIGKTFLVHEAFKRSFAFHHTGLKNASTRKQLDQFRLSLRQQGYFDCPRLKDWLEAFFELENFLSRSVASRKVVFIDEMPWLDTARSGFLTALEGFWNGWASLRNDIVLIACGSATSWIVNKIIRNKDGLYNRVRTRIKLYPFTLSECEAYANEELHLAYARKEIAECYMVFGGVAYYWSLLMRGKSPAQNFDALFFGDQDGLRTEFDELYSSLFRNPNRYIDVVQALGQKRSGLSRDEIIASLGGVSGGDLTRILEDLCECGFIRKYRLPGKKVNGAIFQLIDHFTMFYFEFVRGNASRDGDFWERRLSEGRLNNWRGHAFERLCLDHVGEIKRALGVSGVVADVYSLRIAADERTKSGAEIDLVIDRRDGVVNLCEMKYASGPYAIDKVEQIKLQHRMETYRKVFGERKTLHLTLITPVGLKRNEQAWDVQSEVTLDDLFAF